MARKASRPRPAQGAHLLKLRQDAGLTQWELANAIGENQSSIAFWEMSDKPPRSDALPRLAKALGVTVDDLLVPDQPARRRSGPVGKLQRVFEQAAELPRSQQEKVIDLVETFIRGLRGHT